MKFTEFRKKMRKDIFTANEAHVVAFMSDTRLTNLQLHQWTLRGDLVRLKRGVYLFSGAEKNVARIAQSLHAPCYFSLEYVLNLHGVIPEATFEYTLVTTKPTRRFATPLGTFLYHTIKQEAFTGFDPKTLFAQKEKALVDYFYLRRYSLHATEKFWEESRLGCIGLNFKKIFTYAKLFDSRKLTLLLHSFHGYAKSHQ